MDQYTKNILIDNISYLDYSKLNIKSCFSRAVIPVSRAFLDLNYLWLKTKYRSQVNLTFIIKHGKPCKNSDRNWNSAGYLPDFLDLSDLHLRSRFFRFFLEIFV